MIYDIFLREPLYWIILWALQSVGYYTVLKKMGLRWQFCFIPFLAEWRFSKVMFKRMRSFYRPFVMTMVFTAGAYYLGSKESTGVVYMALAVIIYGVFLIRLYYRMSKCFGHGILFTVGFAVVPTLFLLILGLGRSEYLGPPQFKEERIRSKRMRILLNVLFGVASLAEMALLVAAVGLYTIRTLPPRELINSLLNDTYASTKDITASGECVTRADTMGDDASDLAGVKASRDYYFPDHSQDKSVVVMEYIIGSNLEHQSGLASANIRMMKDATKRGGALTFIVQAGGSGRWFTDGIADETYGRYEIAGGKLEQKSELDSTISMSEPAQIADFIKWTKENYPADRYMLVLWDHGGGLAVGYGQDYLNERKTDDEDPYGTIKVSELADAIKEAGVKFDLIGFDACLMQDIEVAKALEPYADYYLASEEVEGGYGWCYTDPFGRLAEDPGRSTEEFGMDMVSAYDSFNTALNSGEKNTDATLSMVDLTLAGAAYDRLSGFFTKAEEVIAEDTGDFAEISLAASNAYSFEDGLQIDIEDFMEKLGDTDVDDSIVTAEEREDILNAVRACVVCRNKDSGKGVNGLAFAFPYNSIDMYGMTDSELSELSLGSQKSFSRDVFSIIASQKKKEHDAKMKELERDDSRLARFRKFIENITYYDYTQADWYEKGFEDYVTASALIDIPLKETDGGGEYEVELPEKTWKIITDCRTMMYREEEDGSLVYLGADHIGGADADGHPTVAADDTWVSIGGQLVCYEADQPRETDDGTVFSGKVRARLNGKNDVILHIEWDAVSEGEDDEDVQGHVTGYEYEDDSLEALSKGLHKLRTGDRLQFLFDCYDKGGKLTGTDTRGKTVIVGRMDRLKVTDKPLQSGDYRFLGILTDAYQRDIMTEIVEFHID